VKLPAPLTDKNLGLILLSLLAAFVDPSIKLTPDKSQLLERASWTTGVLPYFQNCGRVVQNLKKLKDALDFHVVSDKNWT
jgi:hypothetical protein